MCKVVDDMLLAEIANMIYLIIITTINDRIKLETLEHGRGKLHYFGINIRLHDDFKLTVDADDKLCNIEPFMLPRKIRETVSSKLNSTEAKSFASTNCSLLYRAFVSFATKGK